MIRPIVISSVMPERSAAGQLILYRHLMEDPQVRPVFFGDANARGTVGSFLRKATGRLVRNPRLRESLWQAWKGRWIDGCLPAKVLHADELVVLTVAHGDLFMAAKRYARKQGLPLVSIFHDWWPDLVDVRESLKPAIEEEFLSLYRESDLNLCVSEGMCTALGPHPNSHVLYPISGTNAPGFAPTGNGSRDQNEPFRLYYFGNLGDYDGVIRHAIDIFKEHPGLRLEVRGYGADWPESYTRPLEEKGLLHGFAPLPEFEAWAAQADAFLVTASFEEKSRRRMATSFPSKLVEATRYGKPVVVWGPADASSSLWALGNDRAMVVDNPDPLALVGGVEQLAGDMDRVRRYGLASRDASAGDFNPVHLQERFRMLLASLLPGRQGNPNQ
ncbi:MAG: hypothetical protein ACO3ZW_02635 [Opitutales bacterium]